MVPPLWMWALFREQECGLAGGPCFEAPIVSPNPCPYPIEKTISDEGLQTFTIRGALGNSWSWSTHTSAPYLT